MEKISRSRILVKGLQSSQQESFQQESPGLSYHRRVSHKTGTTRVPNRLRSLGPRYNSMLQSSLASLLIVIQNICVLCQAQDGSLLEFCECSSKLYHEQCINDQIKKNIPKLKEQAFRCLICSDEYKVTGHWIRDINSQGKKSIILVLFWLSSLLGFLVLISQFKHSMSNTVILLCCIIGIFVIMLVIYITVKI